MSDFNATKYKNEFNKESYDRASINFPKGQKAVIEAHWKSKGYKSLNAYVNDLIARDMKPAGGEGIHIQNSSGVIVGDNKGKVIVGDINGNITM
ncbi:hypothetical protein DWX59_13800 [Enterocloster aldenensis]|uniref:hypothetical protein n=1 Tax=Enterocloster aldenensis TaxID=358742 RepID=UPI000E423598|nr:hypothetical protein DWX59_13800 [Enterocloster aldenensis]